MPGYEGPQKDQTKYPELSIYIYYLEELTKDALKLIILKTFINKLGQDIYSRPEKLVIFTSSLVISLIVALVSLLPLYIISKEILKLLQFLRSKYPPEQTLQYSSTNLTSERESNFIRLFKDNNTSRFIVLTKRIIGTSVILTRAFRTINLDTDQEEYQDI